MRCYLSALLIFIASCTGTGANPVRLVQINDNFLNCNEIENEANKILLEFKINDDGQSRIRRKNITAYISGQLLLIPTLFMDVTGAKQIERKALYMRLSRLQELSQAKDC